jgi:hypothetical protein
MCFSCLPTFLSKRAAFWHRDLLGARVLCAFASPGPASECSLSFLSKNIYRRFSSLFLAGARLTRFGYYIGGKITCKIAFSLYAETRRRQASSARGEQKANGNGFLSRMDWIMVKRIYYKADG